MSSDLIQQLKACATKLLSLAETLQQKIKEKKNKNKHYAAVIAEARSFSTPPTKHCCFHLLIFFWIPSSGHPYFSDPIVGQPMALVKQHASQVNEITATAKERVDLAKALIRAVDKPKRTTNSRTSEAGWVRFENRD